MNVVDIYKYEEDKRRRRRKKKKKKQHTADADAVNNTEGRSSFLPLPGIYI